MKLSLEEILQLSPDESSSKSAKDLVKSGKWPLLGFNDIAIWGECQGSGAKPYQVQIDLAGPAFRCTCPSRKFPCKHGLALMILHLQQNSKFTGKELPAWVQEWLTSRTEKAEKKAIKKAAVAATPVDPAVKEKQEQARDQKMLKGLDDLELWMNDQMRHGISALPSQANFATDLAKRMIDSQLPGIAFRMKQWNSSLTSKTNWPELLLGEFGKIQLLIDGFRRIKELPESIQYDLRISLGVTLDKDFVLAKGEKISDEWFVLGQSFIEEDRLWVRRVWLQGKSSLRLALLLDYSHGTRHFEPSFVVGTTAKMTIAFYPGSCNWRGLIVDQPQTIPSSLFPKCTLHDSLQQFTKHLATNPWQWPQPLLLSHFTPIIQSETWFLISQEGQQFPLKIEAKDAWQLLALTAGAYLTFFGEWQNEDLKLLSCWDKQLIWCEGVQSV